MTLDVCLDQALHELDSELRSVRARVAPEALAREIADQFEEAGARYALTRS